MNVSTHQQIRRQNSRIESSLAVWVIVNSMIQIFTLNKNNKSFPIVYDTMPIPHSPVKVLRQRFFARIIDYWTHFHRHSQQINKNDVQKNERNQELYLFIWMLIINWIAQLKN
jgi:hypothetical protein